MELYQQKNAEKFNFELFQHPTAAYRGTPFWAWNTALKRDQLLHQIEVFKQMGLGGFHIHVRTGLETEYLGQEYLALVRACVEKAQQEQMLAWLYDEDRWPSGAAGGLVTVDPQFRARHLLFTYAPYGSPTSRLPGKQDSSARASRTEKGRLLARYAVTLERGYLTSYQRLQENEPAPQDAVIWYAYLEIARNSPWFNNQSYVDTLQKAAIERFIAVTHERYAQTIGDFFGSVVPAIFTDEPQFAHKEAFHFAEELTDLYLPWTDDFLATFAQAYGYHLEDRLPELFWELPEGEASLARYHYHDHIAERFSQAFADTLGAWCQEHHLALTGHMMEEKTLESQTQALGEAMRSYRGFELPGIDILCDSHEYTTAKQAQSAAHQYGRPGVLSELYGVTNWDFDFVGHKAQGDWQAALGITVRVHHLSWVSMAGEAKRDYPASINYQSPWYREYPLVENHFARVNTALTRGKAHVRVGVIHPIESFWLCYGPLEQTAAEREEREQNFDDLTNWLLFGLIDFDFIAESLLPSLSHQQTEARFSVGEGRYDVVIVPSMRTIRATTLERLESFCAHGGKIVFAGEIPSLVDAQPSDRAEKLAARCVHIPLTRRRLLESVSKVREIEIHLANGRASDTLLHQIRQDGENRFVFICNTDKFQACDNTHIYLAGSWTVTVLETLTGEQFTLASTFQDGKTRIAWNFPAHGSLLLHLEPGWTQGGERQAQKRWHARDEAEIYDYNHSQVPVTLSEPNVLLLDQARYHLDDEPWQEVEEVLRIDNMLRQRLGYPLKFEAFAQPWIEKEHRPAEHQVSLAFTIQTTVEVTAPQLALEDATNVSIYLNGQLVSKQIDGWFVDEAIQTLRLPDLSIGTHELILELPFGRQTNLEWCYLLGDFGVEIRGREARIIKPVRQLAFGDWTRQGLPFYAGNVTYHCPLTGNDAEMALFTPKFKTPLLSIALDGEVRGKIAFAPFQCELGFISAGEHTLAITAFGNRVNAFGGLHNTNEKAKWCGPEFWRSEGKDWAYEYQLKPMGLLVAPHLLHLDA
ncbi:glycosyl hydrolase [Tengunoibacter tsumagoiensis]|uniref:Glycoside hydrolase n=1 Tax=Tengunoibacter tsumagoiensis TaxID=2014871 RepID=A0A402A6E1_9CHLR|nr:glycosyl hydrolase [Tengunoibacter tsumagoiensis]GCE14659.1 hypothetical protein KTT_45180 [Tengunoibacter tsumagoiensis]